MQKLFYVVCRWLEEDHSKQADRISSMIQQDMATIGFRYEDIANTERQREELYREREKLIKEKERLEEHKRQVEKEREDNLRLIQERQQLQLQRQLMEQRIR